MKTNSKTLTILIIVIHFLVSCQKETQVKEKSEEAFKSIEAFNTYLNTLDVSEREAAIKKFVSLPSERPNTIRIVQTRNKPERIKSTIDCENLAPNVITVNEQQDVTYNLYPHQIGYQEVQWNVCKSLYGLWNVESKEQIEVSVIANNLYYISNAAHNGSTLRIFLNCPLPLSWSESSYNFNPVPATLVTHVSTVLTVEGNLYAFGLPAYRKGKILINF